MTVYTSHPSHRILSFRPQSQAGKLQAGYKLGLHELGQASWKAGNSEANWASWVSRKLEQLGRSELEKFENPV